MDGFDSYLYETPSFGDVYYNPATGDGVLAPPSLSEPTPTAEGFPSSSSFNDWLATITAFTPDTNLAAPAISATSYPPPAPCTLPAPPAIDHNSGFPSALGRVDFGTSSDDIGSSTAFAFDNVIPSNDYFASNYPFAPTDPFAPIDAFLPGIASAHSGTCALPDISPPIDAFTLSITVPPIVPHLSPSPATSASSTSPSVLSASTPATVSTPATSVSSPASSTSPAASRAATRKMIPWDQYTALSRTCMPEGARVSCPLGCGVSFVRATRMRHLRLHVEKGQLEQDLVDKMQCKHCDKMFSRADSCKRHVERCKQRADATLHPYTKAPRSDAVSSSGPGPTRTTKSRRR